MNKNDWRWQCTARGDAEAKAKHGDMIKNDLTDMFVALAGSLSSANYDYYAQRGCRRRIRLRQGVEDDGRLGRRSGIVNLCSPKAMIKVLPPGPATLR